MLKRYDELEIFKDKALRAILDDGAETDHIFLVLASPVAEVGRDHDYDWAIVEPPSMRSIIQIAGRVRRHRPGAVEQANIVLLNQNLRALTDAVGEPAFKWPGFESKTIFGPNDAREKRYLLKSHELKKLLLPEDFTPLSAAPRIIERTDKPRERLLDLEHARLRSLLVEERAGEYFVRRFWAGATQFTGIEQEAKEFRDSEPQIEMYVWVDEGEVRHFRIEHKTVDTPQTGQFDLIKLVQAERVAVWAVPDCADALAEIPNAETSDPQNLARRFAVFQIGKHLEGKTFRWHPWLGYSDSVD
jgi:CRISPR-associated endonuclease/helicase Cas3